MLFAVKTFGCKVNQYESSAISSAMEKQGFERAASERDADFIIINSCAVTADSVKKAQKEVRRLKRAFPEKTVVLTGCFPQAFSDEAGACGADIVTGTAQREALPGMILRFMRENEPFAQVSPLPTVFEELSPSDSADKTRAFMKIEDGCDNFCAYCIIPYARGRVRSRPIEAVRAEARRFALAGHREIVLTGINLSCYGKDIGLTLADAVEAVCLTDGVERVRLSSLEPELLTDDILTRFAAQKKLCPHFHLSLQSGCNETLKRMNRRYAPEEYSAVVRRLRELFPNAAITTDIMVGFPGESEAEFSQSLAFAQEMRFAKIHAFAYSPREGTKAAKSAEQVPESVKEERFKRLCELDRRLHAEHLAAQVGTVQQVLVQKRTSPEYAAGLTPNYTPVRIYGSAAKRHDIISVRITGARDDHCIGEETDQ